jgi:heme/copper-type cytochrome/quinol oxidase subunit 2
VGRQWHHGRAPGNAPAASACGWGKEGKGWGVREGRWREKEQSKGIFYIIIIIIIIICILLLLFVLLVLLS